MPALLHKSVHNTCSKLHNNTILQGVAYRCKSGKKFKLHQRKVSNDNYDRFSKNTKNIAYRQLFFRLGLTLVHVEENNDKKAALLGCHVFDIFDVGYTIKVSNRF